MKCRTSRPSRVLVVVLLAAMLGIAVPAQAVSAKAGPPPKEPRGIFSLGDSLFNTYPANSTEVWPIEWPLALGDTDYFSTGNDGSNGRSISAAGNGGLAAVATNAAAIAGSDAFITDLGVNDAEMGAAWEQLARQYLAAIRSVNPDVIIHWITPVAEPGVAAQQWVDRATDHAATLRSLHNEGVIDVLIEWDTYALANPSVFDADGIHYSVTGGARAFAEFVAARLAPVPDPLPPSPRCGSTTLQWSVWDRPLDDTVRRIFLGLANREPTPAELDVNRNALTSKGRKAALTEPLLTSAGITGNTTSTDVVVLLYARILERAPGASALATWTGRLDTGLTPAQLAVVLLESPEFVRNSATAEPQSGRQGLLCRIYLAGLGRVPDRPGLDFWTTTGDIRWVANAIAESPEFMSRFPDRTDYDNLINSVYQQVLGRNPEAGGRAYWLGRLRTDLTPGLFVLEVANSAEFSKRTNTLSYR